MIQKQRFLDLLISLTIILCVLTNFGYYQMFNISLVIVFFILVLFNINELKEIKLKLLITMLFTFGIVLFSILQQNSSDIFKFSVWFIEAVIGFYIMKTSKYIKPKFIILTFFLIIFLSSIEGVIQYTTGNITLVNYLNYWGDGLHQGIVSIFLQHIVWGHLLVIGYIANDFLNFTKFKNILRILLLINLFASQARSAWLALLVYFSLMIYRYFKHKNGDFIFSKNKALTLLVAMIIIITTLLLFPNMNQYIQEIKFTIISHINALFAGEANYRIRAIESLISNRIKYFNLFHWLFGSGYGSTSIALSYYGVSLSGERYIVDNQIISLAYDFGIVAVIFIIYMFLDSVKVFIKSNNKSYRLISSLYICNFVMSLVYESFGYQVTAFIFFFTVGAKTACWWTEKK